MSDKPKSMPQPDWSKAPPWATHAAMESSGAWYWYEGVPVLAQHLGIFTSGGFKVEAVLLDTDWKQSAHARPGATPLIAPRKAVLTLTIAAERKAPDSSLEHWLAGGWTRDQLIAEGFAIEVAE